MVLGEPVAREAERLGVAREVDRVSERVAGGEAGRDGRKIEDGEGGHRARDLGPVSTIPRDRLLVGVARTFIGDETERTPPALGAAGENQVSGGRVSSAAFSTPCLVSGTIPRRT